MTLRGLVFIGLRFYAIILSVSAIPILPTLLLAFSNTTGWSRFVWPTIFIPIAYFVMAVVIWLAAGRLASGIAREFNPTSPFQMSFEEALTCGFALVGLYFVLNSLASTVVQLIYLQSEGVGERNVDRESARAVTGLCTSGITAILALVSLVGSRKWAQMLASRRLETSK